MNAVRPPNLTRASALILTAIVLALAALACEDAPSAQPTPAPIAAATAVPTSTPAPPAAVPTNAPAPTAAVPTNAPAPPTAVPTNTPAAPPTATPTAAEAQRIYDDAVDAISALSSYRFHMDAIVDSGMGSKVRQVWDVHVQIPDGETLKRVIAIGAQTPIEGEYVLIDGSLYTKTSGSPFYRDPNAGKWIREYADGESESENEVVSDLLAAFVVDAASGTERLDGVETRRLRGYAYSDELGLEITSDTDTPSEPMIADIWVGVSDGIIRRITAATAPGVPESMEITAVFSDFDVPVAIEAPKDYIERDEAQPPAAPTAAEVETATLSSGWTRAYLPEYGFSLSTPPEWGLFDADRESSYKTDVDYAPEDKLTSSLSMATIHYLVPFRVAGYKIESVGGEKRLSALIVNIMGVLEDAELSEYVDDRMEQTKAALIIDGAIERRTETLPAGEAEVVEFAFRFRDEVFGAFGDTILGMDYDADIDYAQIQYFILSEGHAFILTFATAADRIEAMRPAFAEIAQTARIEPRR